MNSFLIFVLLSSIAVVIHSKSDKNRAAGYPPTIRAYSVPVKDEYMAIIQMKDTEEKFKKMKEWGVKNGKEAEEIVEDWLKKMERNKKSSKTKEEKKKNEPKKDPKKETKNEPKKDPKKETKNDPKKDSKKA